MVISSNAAATTRIETATASQTKNPEGEAVPAGKKPWNTAPQNAAPARPAMRIAPGEGPRRSCQAK
jgi:hypothetical protein